VSARGPVPPPTGGTPKLAPEEARAMVRSYLSEDEERIWFGLTEVYDALLGALDARLLAEHHLSLSMLEALMHVTHAEGGAISVSELAERIRLSPSQVSRIAMDLERRGLVERRRNESDSRSTELAIADAGRALLQQAAPAYLGTIHAHLFDALNERDVKQLARILGRIESARASGRSEEGTNHK
jgi:DNA-binding MarR family transcriptional regulator